MSEETTTAELPTDSQASAAPEHSAASEASQTTNQEQESQEQGSEEARRERKRLNLPPVPYSRFAEINGKFREQEALAQQYRQQLEALQGGGRPDPLAKPQPEDFAGDRAAYDAALDEWSERKAEHRTRETLTRTQQEQKTAALVNDFWRRAEEIAQEIPQIGEAVQIFGQMERDFSPAVYHDIVADKVDGPRIAWEIVNDPEFYAKLRMASPLQAGRLIDQRLSQVRSAAANQASAPNPAAPPPGPAVKPTARVSGAAVVTELPQSGDAYYQATRGKRS